MKNTTNSLFNKWGAGEQNPRGSRFMPTLSRTFGPGENPNTGRSASQFESRKTSKKSERAAESSRKAKELRYEAESQVSDIKKAVDPSPAPLAPNRKQFANTDAGRRAYEFAQQDFNERKAKFDRDMYTAARDKVLAEEKQMAMLKSGNLLKDPGKAPELPAMSGNKIRDAKTLRKYEKELAAWKENASAYLQQRTFLAKLLKEQEEKDDAKKSSTDTQKETLPKSDLDSIRQALSEKPSFSIGADKGSTFVRIDGDGGGVGDDSDEISYPFYANPDITALYTDDEEPVADGYTVSIKGGIIRVIGKATSTTVDAEAVTIADTDIDCGDNGYICVVYKYGTGWVKDTDDTTYLHVSVGTVGNVTDERAANASMSTDYFDATDYRVVKIATITSGVLTQHVAGDIEIYDVGSC